MTAVLDTETDEPGLSEETAQDPASGKFASPGPVQTQAFPLVPTIVERRAARRGFSALPSAPAARRKAPVLASSELARDDRAETMTAAEAAALRQVIEANRERVPVEADASSMLEQAWLSRLLGASCGILAVLALLWLLG